MRDDFSFDFNEDKNQYGITDLEKMSNLVRDFLTNISTASEETVRKAAEQAVCRLSKAGSLFHQQPLKTNDRYSPPSTVKAGVCGFFTVNGG